MAVSDRGPHAVSSAPDEVVPSPTQLGPSSSLTAALLQNKYPLGFRFRAVRAVQARQALARVIFPPFWHNLIQYGR